MTSVSPAASNLSEVLRALAGVTDPELDEPVTELGFIADCRFGGNGTVTVTFRLPTFWCAPNFAFMMAEDMRKAIMAVPGVAYAEVNLVDHMYADEINAGIAGGRSFVETFGPAADGNLEQLRTIFRLKAFQRRQAAVLEHLVEQGWTNDEIVGLTLDELRDLPLSDAALKLRDRYLEARFRTGGPAPLAFVTTTGHAIPAPQLDDYRRNLRGVAVNMEANGIICRGLLQARFSGSGCECGDGACASSSHR
jgi:metal-sulfur cluster biosynthetic enzyme